MWSYLLLFCILSAIKLNKALLEGGNISKASQLNVPRDEQLLSKPSTPFGGLGELHSYVFWCLDSTVTPWDDFLPKQPGVVWSS